MNDLFNNNNFVMGFILANGRPQNERLLAGLTASQFQPNNMAGTLMLKKQIDQVSELEATKNGLEAKVSKLEEANNGLETTVSGLQESEVVAERDNLQKEKDKLQAERVFFVAERNRLQTEKVKLEEVIGEVVTVLNSVDVHGGLASNTDDEQKKTLNSELKDFGFNPFKEIT